MLESAGIHVKVKDFERSKAFYGKLGFKKIFEYGPGQIVDEDYSGATFLLGSFTLEIANGHRAVDEKTFKEDILSSKVSLMVKVPKLSKLLKVCYQNNIELAVKPRHYYWGTLEAVIKDPDGLVIVFIAPYSLKDAKKINASEEFSVKPQKT